MPKRGMTALVAAAAVMMFAGAAQACNWSAASCWQSRSVVQPMVVPVVPVQPMVARDVTMERAYYYDYRPIPRYYVNQGPTFTGPGPMPFVAVYEDTDIRVIRKPRMNRRHAVRRPVVRSYRDIHPLGK